MPMSEPGGAEIGVLVALLDRGQPAEAEGRTQTLLGSHPRSGMLWKILGVARVRQDKNALEALQKAAELMPGDAEAHENLAAALLQRRQWGDALASLERVVELQPRNAQALIDTADTLRELARPRDAVPFYRRALRLEPRLVEARNDLGNALLESNLFAEAIAEYRAALQVEPENVSILCNLASALLRFGLLPEALSTSQRAIRLAPTLGGAYNIAGLALAGLGQFEAAVAHYGRTLAIDPDDVDALNNLGNALRDLGRQREAMQAFQRAVDLEPARPEGHLNAANVLLDRRRYPEAQLAFRRALALRPESIAAHIGLAGALRMLGDVEGAQNSCRAALAIDPASVGALSMLAELHADTGRFDAAERLLRQALVIEPRSAVALAGIAAHRKMLGADGDWLSSTAAALRTPLPLAHEVILRHAVGKYFDDLGQYDPAFASYRAANELAKRLGASYDRTRLSSLVDQVITRFDAAVCNRQHTESSTSERPVFIVGMPRSGTSLVEQILASHPSVFGAGEIIFWDAAHAAGLSQLSRIAHDYEARLQAVAPGSARVVDKMPANFMHAGLIHAAFPRARIIHMQRHPIDTGLSIYFQNFTGALPYATDLGDIAHFYGEYLRITDHWRSSLPTAAWLDVPYEALITDPEAWTRRLLAFIGLPWDPACLEFHRTERVVLTASRWQVRQKIASTSAGRWRNYRAHLGALEHLGSGVIA
jgi:tetratricopeptide (TPR) repeat protein